MGMSTRLYSLPDRDGMDKSLIPVEFEYEDEDEYFFYEDKYGIAKLVLALSVATRSTRGIKIGL